MSALRRVAGSVVTLLAMTSVTGALPGAPASGAAQAAPTPTSGDILFTSGGPGPGGADSGILRLWRMRADGSGATAITDVGDDYQPAVSPDGRYVVFKLVNSGGSGIYRLRVDGSHLTALTNPSGGADGQPHWSPDGRRIAYVHTLGLRSRLRVMRADGTHDHRLGHLSGSFPSYLPGGRRIVFARQGGARPGIYTAHVDGTKVRRLTHDAEDSQPLPSPDGRSIVFVRRTAGTSAVPPHSDVYRMDVDGSGLVDLTPDVIDDHDPAWSPDGRSIAFMKEGDGNSHVPGEDFDRLWSMSADGSDPVLLPGTSFSDGAPTWMAVRSYRCTAPLGDSCGAYDDTTFSFNSNRYNTYVSNQDLGLLGSQTIHANGPRQWKIVSDTPDDGGRVQTFPNAQQLFNDYTTPDGTYPVSVFSSLKVHYDETSPGGSGNTYQFSPDIFFGNYANDVMFWTDVHGRCNEGAFGPSLLGHFTTPDGSGWSAHRYDSSPATTGNTGAEIILVKDGVGGPGTCAHEPRGTIDVKAGLEWLAGQGFLPATPRVSIVQTGWEITQAHQATFVVNAMRYEAVLN